jgi:hypothetical protein
MLLCDRPTTVNFCVIAIACFQAVKARNIQSEFSEATYIGLCMCTLCQAYLSGIPIVVVVRDIPKAFYLVLTVLILLLCMTILLLVFLPKVLLQKKYNGMSRREQKAMMMVKLRKSISGLSIGGFSPGSLSNSSMHKGDSSYAPNPMTSPPRPTVNFVSSGGSSELKVKMSETSSKKSVSTNLTSVEMTLEVPSSAVEPSSEDHSNQTPTVTV